jgi:hypothetical protein
MIVFYVLFGVYILAILINASYCTDVDKRNYDNRVITLAYQFWRDSLNKKGYPRNESGSLMNTWQLYTYWMQKVDHKPWLLHAQKETIKNNNHLIRTNPEMFFGPKKYLYDSNT